MFSTRSSQKSRNLALNDGACNNKRRTLKRRNAAYLDFNDDSTISSSLVQKFKTSSNAENYRQGGDKSKHLEVLRKSLQSLANEIHNDSKELTSLIKESLNRPDSNIDIASKASPALPASEELKELKDTIRQLTKGVSSENKQIKSLLQDSLSSHNKSSSGSHNLMVAHSDEKPTLGLAEDPENSLVRRALDEVKDNVNNLGRVFRELLGRRTADAVNCSVPTHGPKNTPITDQLKLHGWDTQRSPALSGIQLSSGGQSQATFKTDELAAPKASSSATDSILLEALAVMKESIMAMSKVSTSEVAANRTPNNSTELSNALSEIRKCLQTIEELKSRRSEKPIVLDASVAATTSAEPKATPVKFTAHSHDKRKRNQHRKKASHHKRHPPLGMSYWMPQPPALYSPFTPRWYAPTTAVQPSTAPSVTNNSMSRSASYDY
ncbi:hypothetical protein AAHC03_024222 [Spirometra sp. Aus1]